MTTLTQDRTQAAQDLLAAADSAFASGDNLGGSKKMRGAAASALKAVAQRLGGGAYNSMYDFTECEDDFDLTMDLARAAFTPGRVDIR